MGQIGTKVCSCVTTIPSMKLFFWKKSDNEDLVERVEKDAYFYESETGERVVLSKELYEEIIEVLEK